MVIHGGMSYLLDRNTMENLWISSTDIQIEGCQLYNVEIYDISPCVSEPHDLSF